MTQSSAKPAPGHSTWTFRLLAIAKNVLLGVLFSFFTFASYVSWQRTGHVQMLLLAFMELLIVGLAITRHHSIEESRTPWDWTVALIGTCAPLLQRPGGTFPGLESIGLGLQLVGALLASVAVISLGRSFGIVAANRGVRTGGLYRFVRHPLYGSYLVGYLGFLLGNLSFANVALIAATIVCQYLRSVAEERILLHDPAYRAYATRVRYRFLPYIF